MKTLFMSLLFIVFQMPLFAATGVWPISGGLGKKSDVYDSYRSGSPFFHNGIDIAVASGTDVVAAEGGLVVNSFTEQEAGGTVRIQVSGRSNEYHVYTHLQQIIALDADVAAGSWIGTVAYRTPISHLHFGIYASPDKFTYASENPLRSLIPNATVGALHVDGIKFFEDDSDSSGGNKSVTKYLDNSIYGKVDVVAHAYEETGVVQDNNPAVPQDAGVHQLSYAIENVTYNTINLAQEERFFVGYDTFASGLLNMISEEVYKCNSCSASDPNCALSGTRTDDDLQIYYYILTNNTDPQYLGRRDYFQSNGSWNTLVSKDDLTKDSIIPEDAQYPDGKYKVRVRAAGDGVNWTNPGGLQGNAAIGVGYREVTVDNFRPYVKTIRVKRDGTTIYERTWTKEGAVLKSPVPSKYTILELNNSQLELEFSEPVKDVRATLGGMAVSNMYSTDAVGQEKNFHAEIAITKSAISEGYAVLEISAKDKQGNMLLALDRPKTQIDPATELTRAADGVGIGGLCQVV